jgi:hypothetical protein
MRAVSTLTRPTWPTRAIVSLFFLFPAARQKGSLLSVFLVEKGKPMLAATPAEVH